MGGFMKWRREGSGHPEAEDRTGWLADADPVEQGFVLMLRSWLDGPQAQAALWDALVRSAGVTGARRILACFEQLIDVLARSALRAFRRHATRCPCLGADEAALSGMVRAAARGRRAAAESHVRGLLREADLVEVVERAARLGMQLDEAGAYPTTSREARTLH